MYARVQLFVFDDDLDIFRLNIFCANYVYGACKLPIRHNSSV